MENAAGIIECINYKNKVGGIPSRKEDRLVDQDIHRVVISKWILEKYDGVFV
jgi:hypothetical protein